MVGISIRYPLGLKKEPVVSILDKAAVVVVNDLGNMDRTRIGHVHDKCHGYRISCKVYENFHI